jgi:hypothetical protein
MKATCTYIIIACQSIAEAMPALIERRTAELAGGVLPPVGDQRGQCLDLFLSIDRLTH